ncbi:MAG: DUF2099 family protein [Candidatus Omnitrophica bacterium]|nr:DUF2099 family protein [Candidatus Omnitrophota bacterium]MDD5775467.1 DUF2099 family protein [Candidatus Omnitrophota bacterium]
MHKPASRDVHVLRYFSSFIGVSDGKVIYVSDPLIKACPLASHLYKGLKAVDSADKEALKRQIKKIIESKIRDFGFCTAKRKLLRSDSVIAYGASEMLMAALKMKVIDSAVIVCDGAGTIITNRPDVVQGIGARMNSVLLTSPIRETIVRLKSLGCIVAFDNALIDQAHGVEQAIRHGYKRIAVTVSGHDAGILKRIRQIESAGNATVTILAVCTTGVTAEKIEDIRRYGDIVWSCASQDIREHIGTAAVLQISKQIPVFVLTRKGIDLFSASAQDPAVVRGLDTRKKYLISHETGGRQVKSGRLRGFLREREALHGHKAG